MKRLVDTNAYVGLKRGHVGVADLIRSAEQVYVSIIVLGELLYGFHGGGRRSKNLEDLEAFLSHPFVSVQYLSRSTADRFGRVAAALKAAGKPIPTNDIWIAAHALDLGAELVTFDAHFEWVPGLVVSIPA